MFSNFFILFFMEPRIKLHLLYKAGRPRSNTFRVLSKNYIPTAILYPVKTFTHEGKQIKDIFRQSLKNLTSHVPFLRKH